MTKLVKCLKNGLYTKKSDFLLFKEEVFKEMSILDSRKSSNALLKYPLK